MKPIKMHCKKVDNDPTVVRILTGRFLWQAVTCKLSNKDRVTENR